jgi:hypothetical protein
MCLEQARADYRRTRHGRRPAGPPYMGEMGTEVPNHQGRRVRPVVPPRRLGHDRHPPGHQGQQRAPGRRHERAPRKHRAREAIRPRRRPAETMHVVGAMGYLAPELVRTS